jgi:hypothetical protein
VIVRPARAFALALALAAPAVGCQAYKEKKALEAVAEGVSTSLLELRSLDGEITRHHAELRQASPGSPAGGLPKARAVVADHQLGKKAADSLSKRVVEGTGRSISSLHQLNALRIAAIEYSLAAHCVDPQLELGPLGLPNDRDCLPRCEAAWGKLVQASAELRATAKGFEIDLPAIRER